MWIKTESGALVNLDRVTTMEIVELDGSLLWNEGTPWGIVWRGDGMRAVLARYATREEAERGMAELYTIAKKV